MSDGAIKHVVVLGGGSAGWLTACRLASDHLSADADGLQVTLIESPDVAILGVGEGTWPTMRSTLQRIGLSETHFIRNCDASFKQGTCFDAWRTGKAGDRYYHPFMVPVGDGSVATEARWQAVHDSFGEAVTPQVALCEAGRAPKQPSTPEYASVANYGYHLDAGKFATELRLHATHVLGVRHVLDHVTAVVPGEGALVAALETRGHGRIEADLFVDCSGFASVLLAQHHGVGWIDHSHCLKNDSALAAQVPYLAEDAPIASATLSTAQEAGWIWDIGLPTRRGTGYTFASAYTRDEDAERALRAYLARTASPEIAAEASVRKLTFRPGHRERFWVGNCVAVGMAAGFLEPLEASALVMVELAAGQISDSLPANKASLDAIGRRFNTRFLERWGRIIDFLKLHYVLSERQDKAYWHDMRVEGISDRLADLMALWRHEAPSALDFTAAEEIFPAASYKYVYYGMGQGAPNPATRSRRGDTARIEQAFRQVDALKDKWLAGLPDNRTLINLIAERGLPAASRRASI